MYYPHTEINILKQKKRTTRMKKKFFSLTLSFRHWKYIMTFFLSLLTTVQTWGQIGGESTTEELVSIGFENVRWTENDKERIYTIENNVFKAN